MGRDSRSSLEDKVEILTIIDDRDSSRWVILTSIDSNFSTRADSRTGDALKVSTLVRVVTLITIVARQRIGSVLTVVNQITPVGGANVLISTEGIVSSILATVIGTLIDGAVHGIITGNMVVLSVATTKSAGVNGTIVVILTDRVVKLDLATLKRASIYGTLNAILTRSVVEFDLAALKRASVNSALNFVLTGSVVELDGTSVGGTGVDSALNSVLANRVIIRHVTSSGGADVNSALNSVLAGSIVELDGTSAGGTGVDSTLDSVLTNRVIIKYFASGGGADVDGALNSIIAGIIVELHQASIISAGVDSTLNIVLTNRVIVISCAAIVGASIGGAVKSILTNGIVIADDTSGNSVTDVGSAVVSVVAEGIGWSVDARSRDTLVYSTVYTIVTVGVRNALRSSDAFTRTGDSSDIASGGTLDDISNYSLGALALNSDGVLESLAYSIFSLPLVESVSCQSDRTILSTRRGRRRGNLGVTIADVEVPVGQVLSGAISPYFIEESGSQTIGLTSYISDPPLLREFVVRSAGKGCKCHSAKEREEEKSESHLSYSLRESGK